MTQPTDNIRDMEFQLLELSETIEELSKSTREAERDKTIEIEERWETTKDKSLSNSTKRNVIAEEELCWDPEYITNKEQLEGYRKEKARMEIELRFMLREDREKRMKLDITVAEALSTLLQKVYE